MSIICKFSNPRKPSSQSFTGTLKILRHLTDLIKFCTLTIIINQNNMKKIFFYIAAALTLLWGISHLFPTSSVVRNFGDISTDNKLIITMEWIVEGMALSFLGLLTIIVTKTDTESKLARNVYLTIVIMLFSLAIVSLFTGFRVNFLPFKLCPVIFSLSAILIILGMKTKSSLK